MDSLVSNRRLSKSLGLLADSLEIAIFGSFEIEVSLGLVALLEDLLDLRILVGIVDGARMPEVGRVVASRLRSISSGFGFLLEVLEGKILSDLGLDRRKAFGELERLEIFLKF